VAADGGIKLLKTKTFIMNLKNRHHLSVAHEDATTEWCPLLPTKAASFTAIRMPGPKTVKDNRSIF